MSGAYDHDDIRHAQALQTAAVRQIKQITTKYVVLRCVDPIGLDTWELIGEAEGYSPKAAIKKVTDDLGTYVAVPTRSWNPTTRTKETTTQDVWS